MAKIEGPVAEQFCCRPPVGTGQPVLGTAPAGIREYLLVEDHGPWGPKAPNALALLPLSDKQRFDAICKAPGRKTLFVRQPKNPATMPQAKRRFWWAQLSAAGSKLYALGRMSISELCERVDSAGVSPQARDRRVQTRDEKLGGEVLQDGSIIAPVGKGSAGKNGNAPPSMLEIFGIKPEAEVHTPMLLVCTHGQRDRCCSLEGMPVYLAMRNTPGLELWQSSHLGGHRFAATALALPSGYMWGNLRKDDAVELARGVVTGELTLPERLRGHSGLRAMAQIADVEFRRRESRWDLSCDPSLWTATGPRFVAAGGAELQIRLREEIEVLGSCGDTKLKRVPVYECVDDSLAVSS